MNTKQTGAQKIQAIWAAYDRDFRAACKATTPAEQSRLACAAADRRDAAIQSAIGAALPCEGDRCRRCATHQ